MLKCQPHRWSWPEPGDSALVCARCARVLPFEGLRYHQVRGIVKAGRRIHGREKGEQFATALIAALNSHQNRLTLSGIGRIEAI